MLEQEKYYMIQNLRSTMFDLSLEIERKVKKLVEVITVEDDKDEAMKQAMLKTIKLELQGLADYYDQLNTELYQIITNF